MNYMKASVLAVCLGAIAIGCESGGGREVVKKEVKDEPRLMGGRKYEENTTYRNADGSYSTEQKKIKTP